MNGRGFWVGLVMRAIAMGHSANGGLQPPERKSLRPPASSLRRWPVMFIAWFKRIERLTPRI